MTKPFFFNTFKRFNTGSHLGSLVLSRRTGGMGR